MKKIIVVWSELNNIGFGVEVEEVDVEKAAELAWEGFARWNSPEEYREYHDVGYAEPSMFLLDEAGISYRILPDEELTIPENPNDWNPNIEYMPYPAYYFERKRREG